ncbi:HNH endonuclease [Natranaerofaba carboxydovora]|uniref:HNH endonuclease n=1 Tax=Natranaerofaba carboxydovora TaxID=2742683 RepID=UPI001F132D30|nr:HNH endonuclease signature motif containing protein [Natranaerofaba carboxydovora]UMZ72546.1 hypothetical protein ACONDI_00067 [Natranaerofaba carboxydovora]
MICGLSKIDLLIGSHIKPWRYSNDEEKLDEDNGLLMCNVHDAPFDKGYISFEDSGKIIISSKLNKKDCNLLGINENIIIKLRPEQIKYIKWHRENILKS